MPIEAANNIYKQPIFNYNYNMNTATTGPSQIPNSQAVMQAHSKKSTSLSINLVLVNTLLITS